MDDQFHEQNNGTSGTGSGYTTPDGGYGYVYTPQSSPDENGRKGGKVFLIVSVVVMVLLLGGCILLGTLLVRGNSRSVPEGGTEAASEQTSASERATGGMFIVIDPDASDTEAPDDLPTEPAETLPAVVDDGSDTAAVTELSTGTSEQVPEQVTIIKKSSSRPDSDGDGHADIVLDENGYVVTSAGDKAMPIPTVVYRVKDAVVEITTETIVRSSRMGQYVTSGAGSGVIISAEGLIVTNNHVIEKADNITVTLTDGSSFKAKLIGTDEQADIALLWIDAGDRQLTVATLGASCDLVVGEDIIAIGNPLGSLGGTVTEGIVSATARNIEIDSNDMILLQVSSPINPGNSGGGLFNMAGELIGVVNAKMSETDVEGLGFAIPVDTAYEIISELYKYGYVRGRPATGLTTTDVTSTMTAMYYFSSPYTGVYITGSQIDELKTGDLIVTFDGKQVSSTAEINKIVQTKKPGDTVEVEVLRGAKERITVSILITEYVPAS